MLFRILIAGVLLSSAALADDRSDTRRSAAGLTPEASTEFCKHYVNRARFKSRGEGQDFVTTLADACLIARQTLVDGDAAAVDAAQNFLIRLTQLRDTIIEMNMTRTFGRSYKPRMRISGARATRTGPIPLVSETGEFLIAHRMGLIRSMKVWLDSQPSVAMALHWGQ